MLYYVKTDKAHLEWHIMSYISLMVSANIKKAVIIMQLFLPTKRGRKTKVMLYVHHQSFKRHFGQRMDYRKRLLCANPVYETFKQRNTSNDLGLSSSFSSSTSWQN